MALAHAHILLLCQLRQAGIAGSGNTDSILEFGEQNWYGDVHPEQLFGVINTFHTDEQVRAERTAELKLLLDPSHRPEWLFDLAKFFYRLIFDWRSYRAIDMHGTASAERHDLNVPLPFEDQYDVVTNLGTAEHVFNQYQVFQSLHARTRPGGLMIHSLPNQGCYDHGFYNYHPTFIFDLCRANRYEMISLLYYDGTTQPGTTTPIPKQEDYVLLAVTGRLSNYSGLLAVLRKAATESPFQIPMQGYYANELPPHLMEAWNRLPR